MSFGQQHEHEWTWTANVKNLKKASQTDRNINQPVPRVTGWIWARTGSFDIKFSTKIITMTMIVILLYLIYFYCNVMNIISLFCLIFIACSHAITYHTFNTSWSEKVFVFSSCFPLLASFDFVDCFMTGFFDLFVFRWVSINKSSLPCLNLTPFKKLLNVLWKRELNFAANLDRIFYW